MKRPISYSTLWKIELDIDNLDKNHPAVLLFLDKQIKSFVKNPFNESRIREMHKGMHEIQLKYIVHEKHVPQYTDESHSDWKWLPSVMANDEEVTDPEAIRLAYQAEIEEFLKRSVMIEI